MEKENLLRSKRWSGEKWLSEELQLKTITNNARTPLQCELSRMAAHKDYKAIDKKLKEIEGK